MNAWSLTGLLADIAPFSPPGEALAASASWLPVAALVALLVATSITDIRQHRIPNALTYPGILLLLALNGLVGGWPGLEDALKGFLLCGGLMLVCFVVFLFSGNIGGGDVKLVAMIGAALGAERGVEALLWTFLLGALMGMAIVVWERGIGNLLKKTFDHAKVVVESRGWVPLTPEERAPLQRLLFLAPSALAAVCLVLADRQWGLYSRW